MGDSPVQRTKRQRIDKHGRFAALERLKNLKGAKNKYDGSDNVDNIYDLVDEKEYSKRVLERANDDWIEDDGTGYVEDGREIFDDECIDEPINEKQSKKADGSKSTGNKKRRLRDINADTPVQGKGSIRSLFTNSVSTKKKKVSTVNLAEDDILADILGEMDTTKSNTNGVLHDSGINSTITVSSSTSVRGSNIPSTLIKLDESKLLANDYLKNFSRSIKRKSNLRADDTDVKDEDDDEIINRLLKKPDKDTKNYNTNDSIKLTDINAELDVNKDLINSKESAVDSTATPTGVNITDNISQSMHVEHDSTVTVDESSNDYANVLNAFDDDSNGFDTSIVDSVKNKNEKSEPDNFADILANWENVCNMEQIVDEDVQSESNNEQPSLDEDELRMWFYDAWEDPFKCPGKVFLFGKVAMKNGTSTTSSSKEYQSICVQIENVEKCLYLLPREYALDPITKSKTKEKVTMMNVYTEFAELMGNEPFRSKSATKNFAFNIPGVDVPATCEYLEIRYVPGKKMINFKQKFNTIAHIFGTTTNSLEQFLLECKIKGPTWLKVKNFKENTTPFSWCKREIICSSQKCITIAADSDGKSSSAPPPIVMLSIYIRSAVKDKESGQSEILMISCLVNRNFPIDKPPTSSSRTFQPFQQHFCGIAKPSKQIWPFDIQQKILNFKGTQITKCDSERNLLSWFLAKFRSIDADLIVTYDSNDCQLDMIYDRLAILKIPLWASIGRLRLTTISGKKFKDFFIGRLICDLKLSAEELTKLRSFDFDTLCKEILKLDDTTRPQLIIDDITVVFNKTDDLLKLITITMQECLYIIKIMLELNILPLALQITNICGNLYGRTLQGGRNERNEYLLLHAFTRKDYIVPDKRTRDFDKQQLSQQQSVQQSQRHNEDEDNVTKDEMSIVNSTSTAGGAGVNRKKAAYSGGLVLEPIKGFYDQFILLMDFNSLYPSIIQEYNICFTTITTPSSSTSLNLTTDFDQQQSMIPLLLPDPSVEQGILPEQIRRLVESRKEVKKLMLSPDLTPEQRIQYDIRQMALKLTANSMYGCLGFAQSRFFAQHLAALVTLKGREILMSTKDIVQKLHYEVVYGDTDSIMIKTNSIDFDHVMRVGLSIKQAINKQYRKIELDIDGIFKNLLLLKKKKYAAVTIKKLKDGKLSCKQEIKGLDMVRRDWSKLSANIGTIILDELFSDNQMDDRIANIHACLEKLSDDLRNDKLPIELLVITKQLTKMPRDYTNITTLPHVVVALRMNMTRNKHYKKGDMIDYIICEDGTNNPAMQRAYHIQEYNTMGTLKIDKQYYLSQQIHPVVTRLLEPLPETDPVRIATCLGLDPSKYRGNVNKTYDRPEDGVGESITKSTSQKFRSCDKFTFKCIACGTANLIASPVKEENGILYGVLSKCSNAECSIEPCQYVGNIKNELLLTIREKIKRFYENWLVCDEPNCNINTRVYTHILKNNRPICVFCKKGVLVRQYSECDLNIQLMYYQYMFDTSKYDRKNLRLSPEAEAAYSYLKDVVDSFLHNSAYCVVSLSKMFSRLHPSVLKDQSKACIIDIDLNV